MTEAETRIHEAITPLQHAQILPIKHCLNRILAQDITATSNIPSDCNSSMDGYAVAFNDLCDHQNRLRLCGTSWAGKPYSGVMKPGDCVRIFTGAILPQAADTVIMQEQVTQTDGMIQFNGQIQHGDNVRYPGEDIKSGDTVLNAGTKLGGAEIGLLASLGMVSVQVYRPIRVAFFSTGDELRGLTETLQSGQLYDSNRYTLNALIEQIGAAPIDLGTIPDDPQQLQDTLINAAESSDAVISTGGASVGDADFIEPLLKDIGSVDFWKLAIKPGKPLVFGNIRNIPFFGLPGNPVSVLVTFMILVRPALTRLMGQTPGQMLHIEVPLAQSIQRSPGRQEYLRAQLNYDNNQLNVKPLPFQGSHIMHSMIQANCFIVVEAHCSSLAQGQLVKVLPFDTEI